VGVTARVPSAPLAGDVNGFLDHCLDRDLALTTVETYTQVLSAFVAWMAANYPDVDSVTEITLAHLQHFRRHLRLTSAAKGRELKPRTLAKYLATLRSLLKYYAVHIGAPVLAREHVKLPVAPDRTQVQALNNQQLERLLATPPIDKLWGLRDRAIIALMGRVGLRLNEVCSLNRRDVREDLLTKEPQLRLIVSAGPRADRPVMLDPETQRYLHEYLQARKDDYQPLFIRHKPGKGAAHDDPNHRLTRQMVNKMLVKYGRQARLTCLPSAPSLRQGALATAIA